MWWMDNWMTTPVGLSSRLDRHLSGVSSRPRSVQKLLSLIETRPISPASISSFMRRDTARRRALWPTASLTPAPSAASTMARECSRLWAMGFSQ